MKPRIYLTNAAAVVAVRRGTARPETRACVGPGRVWTIMALPRAQYGEAGEGRVTALTPTPNDLRAVQHGEIDEAEYRRRFEAKVSGGVLIPGMLDSRLWAGADEDTYPASMRTTPVSDGDTLICSCSRHAAENGHCHRAWAAPWLFLAGWDVRFDARDLDESQARAVAP